MKTMIYAVVALFASSLLFVGSSFSNEMQMSEEMTGTTPMAVSWNTCKASDLVGANLEGPSGSAVDIGSINDLAINPSTGKIDSLLVSDILGLGAQEIAIPFHDVSMLGGITFVYNPPGDMYLFKGENPFRAYDLLSLPPMPEGDYRVTSIFGAIVESKEGQNVAHIDDLIVNADGHVVYAVLRDVSGRGNELVAAPFEALSKKGGFIFALDTTQDRLSAAPVFSWSDVTSPKYASDIYRYYGLQPYWETK